MIFVSLFQIELCNHFLEIDWQMNRHRKMGNLNIVESHGWKPAADVYHTPDGWMVKFDLAGIRPEELILSLQGNSLQIEGTRRDYQLESGIRHYSMEIAYSRFERSIEFPCDLEKASLSTSYENGILLVRIKLPKGGQS